MFNFGYALLIFTTAATAVAMIAYAPGVRKNPGRPALRTARVSVFVTAAGLVAMAAYLWHLILGHQFQYDYVFRYSSLDMPFRYVFASFWGGQEGTFLLWGVYGGLLAVFLRFKAKQYEAPVLFFYLGINLFLMFMLLKRSPFAPLLAADGTAVTPPDGNGLNPLLQDPWMTIHPPVMFFGFASLGIPAAYAMAAMVKEDWDNWVHRSIPWTIFGIMALGTGLVMGGYWAYSILGWGGFWGWDPVENSSLVPWLLAVGLLHNQVIQLKRGIFRRANLLLAMAPFLLLTYSTFLTRSGILADFSVHSFTDLGINQFLAAFMIVFVSGGLLLFLWKFRRVPVERVDAPLLSREYFMFLGSLAFVLFGLFVLLGTSAPWFTRWWGAPANVQPEFYNRMGLPFAVLIGFLVGLAPHLVWKRASGARFLRRILVPLGATLLFALAAFLGGVRQPNFLLLTAAGVFAVFSNLQVVLQIGRRTPRAVGGYLAHVGIGFCLVGILTSTVYSESKQVVLPQDEEVLALGYGFKYLGHRPVEDGRKDAYDVVLRTADGAHVMSPTMFFSDFNAGMMKKPAIQSFWARDVYVSPINHAAEPLDERIETRVVLNKKQPRSANGMVLDFQRFTSAETEAAHDHDSADGHGHEEGAATDVAAEILVTVGEETVTVNPVLRTFPDGHSEALPAVVPATGQRVSLIGVDPNRNRAQIGIQAAPVVINQGESAEIQGFHVHFHGFEVDMGKRRNGSAKVFAKVTVAGNGESMDLMPGLISRPGAEELEVVEEPIGRTGLSLVLAEIEPNAHKASFHVAPTAQEYFYAEVSTKPFIGLLWIGTVVTVIGLAIATAFRGRAAGRFFARVMGNGSETANGKREAA